MSQENPVPQMPAEEVRQTRSNLEGAQNILSAIAQAKEAPAETQPAPEAPKPAAPVPPPAEPPKPISALAAEIRADRERRQSQAQREQAEQGLKEKLAQAEERIRTLETSKVQFEDDPVGYGKAKGWTRDQQLLYGQSLLYDIAPDKAPNDFRLKMFEDKYARAEREKAEAMRQAQEQQAQYAGAMALEDFQARMVDGIKSVSAGAFPESEDYFVDANAYLHALLTTANDMAEVAEANNQNADLSFASVARELEADVARKMSQRDTRAAKRREQSAPKPQPTPARPVQPVSQEPIGTFSTRNVNSGGAPKPPAQSEGERISRAAAALFGTNA